MTVQVDVDASVLPVELVDPLVDLEHFVEVVLVWGQPVVAVFGSIEYGAYHNPVKKYDMLSTISNYNVLIVLGPTNLIGHFSNNLGVGNES